MSIAGNAGASCAAGDVRNFIQTKLLTKPELSDETRRELLEVVKYCDGIEKSADAGWY